MDIGKENLDPRGCLEWWMAPQADPVEVIQRGHVRHLSCLHSFLEISLRF